MVKETIERIESRINGSEGLTIEKKQELLLLVAKLRTEVTELAATNHDEAHRVASFTETSVHEATRNEIDSVLLTHSLKGMALSVRRLEVSHPRLVGLINSIGQTLSNIGI